MVFSSQTFLFAFLPAVLLIYYLVPQKAKNMVLLLASLLFYAWGEPVYVLLMIFSCLVNYSFARLIEAGRDEGIPAGTLKLHFICNLAFNLGILFYFKYINMFLSGLGLLFGADMTIHGLSLPIGISFYTFQAISYCVDVYKGKIRAQKNVFDFTLYITMFPQLIAGPIVRYTDIADKLHDRKLTLAGFGIGCEMFITGLAKKVLLANTLGALFDDITALGNITWLAAWLGALLYSLQLYFDFSGYSDMAIGLGSMLGFKFPQNFDHPYISRSVTEFWRRWHMTLSSWFKEYVYIPLGGNRVSTKRHIINLLIVWMLTGLWHGAGVNFILWGLYYGLFLIFEKYVIKNFLESHHIFGHIYTCLVFVFGWVIFAFTDAGELTSYIASLLFIHGFADTAALYYCKVALIPMILGIICSLPWPYKIKRRFMSRAPWVVLCINVILLILSIACIVYDSYNPFLYFRF